MIMAGYTVVCPLAGGQQPREGGAMKEKNNPGSIDAYIAAQAEEIRPLLQKVREAIRRQAPNAHEKISYGLPTFWQGENLIHFAACSHHIGIYPGGEATKAFAQRLKGYKTSKGAIQLPLGEPIDYALIADLTAWRVKQAAG